MAKIEVDALKMAHNSTAARTGSKASATIIEIAAHRDVTGRRVTVLNFAMGDIPLSGMY